LHLENKILLVKICKTIILPVVLYGFKIWYLTLKEERIQGARKKNNKKNIFTEGIESNRKMEKIT
jgi:hypothetical protein